MEGKYYPERKRYHMMGGGKFQQAVEKVLVHGKMLWVIEGSNGE